MWEHGVIDATMGARDGMLCFCPVELDENGEIAAVVTGMNYLGSPPPSMKIIALVHEDGQDACEAFYAEHKALIEPFLHNPELPVLRTEPASGFGQAASIPFAINKEK